MMAESNKIESNKMENGKKVLFSIRNLKKYFPVKGHKNMFVKANDGITIDIYEGETLGLVGESGCGKSTLGRTLLQLYPPTEGRTLYFGKKLEEITPKYYEDASKKLSSAELEQLRDEGVDLAKLSYNEMRTLRRDMQIIFQDPYSSLNPRMTVGQIIGEGPLAHGFFQGPGEALQNHVMQVMEDCGLASYMIHRYPHQFSGGQRQRIGIARALAVNPKFVVCDEAVSALDVSIQSQILNLLSDLKEKDNLTYLFISHALSVVKYISDRIGVMYLGNIVEIARSEDIFRHPLHPYTEALLSAIPTTNVDKPKNSIILEGDIPSPINPPRGCKFHTRCRYVTDICKEHEPQLNDNGAGHLAACHHCLV